MRVVSFKQGVHPPGKKEATRRLPIEDLPLPDKVIIPLIQHTGKPNMPLVKKGDKVLKGQLIGETSAFISSSVHASLSGQVLAIEPRPHPLGIKINSIVIESDEKDNAWCCMDKGCEAGLPQKGRCGDGKTDWRNIASDKIKEIIRNAGLVGLGGAAFPTHVKLSPPKDKKIEYLIINGAECEPCLTSDERIMLEYSREIVEGIEILKKVLEVKKVFLGIELNKPECIAKMSEAIGERDVEMVGLKTKYPQGGEKQLIKAILGKEVPRKGLPMDIGCVVQNVGTVKAVRDAVCEGKPLIERIVTVTGSGVTQPKNLRVRIGTQFLELLNFCNVQKDSLGKVIMGGPMMGISQYNLEVPVIKGTSGIVAMKKEEVYESKHRQCIRCGRCVETCPAYLMPYEISIASENNRFDLSERLGVFDCIECGICGYVCPATRYMVYLMKKAKAYILEGKKPRHESLC